MQCVQHVTHSVKIDHLVRFNILKHVSMQNRGNMNESISKKEKIQKLLKWKGLISHQKLSASALSSTSVDLRRYCDWVISPKTVPSTSNFAHFSCCSLIVSTTAAAPWLHQLQLFSDYICFSCYPKIVPTCNHAHAVQRLVCTKLAHH